VSVTIAIIGYCTCVYSTLLGILIPHVLYKLVYIESCDFQRVSRSSLQCVQMACIEAACLHRVSKDKQNNNDQ
jgi:hypothetical protein